MHPLNLVIASFSLCSDTCAWFEIFSNYVLKFMVLFFFWSILFFQVNGWFSKKPVQIFVCELSKDCLNLYYIVVNPKRKFMFLFLKITSWFYLFSPHPSFFLKIPEKIMNVEALCKCIVCEFHLRFLCLFITVDFCRCGWRLLHLMMKIYECKCYFYIVYNMFAMGNVNVESQKYCPYFLNTNCYFI